MGAASTHVVLVHPEIPWNTGSVGRSCLAAGAALHLVRPLGFSLTAKEVRRAGLDYWERLQPRIWPDWQSLERALPDLGQPFLFSAEGTRALWDVAFPPRAVLLFGRESAGLPAALREKLPEALVRIPIDVPEVRSLNLANSVAIALYEVARQRRSLRP